MALEFLEYERMKRIYSKTVTWIISAGYVALFGYGFFAFPDAPIKPCPNGFCGKFSSTYSETDYQTFVMWDRSLMIATVILVIYSLVGWILKKNGKF